jgi:hypothetical protein
LVGLVCVQHPTVFHTMLPSVGGKEMAWEKAAWEKGAWEKGVWERVAWEKVAWECQ